MRTMCWALCPCLFKTHGKWKIVWKKQASERCLIRLLWFSVWSQFIIQESCSTKTDVKVTKFVSARLAQTMSPVLYVKFWKGADIAYSIFLLLSLIGWQGIWCMFVAFLTWLQSSSWLEYAPSWYSASQNRSATCLIKQWKAIKYFQIIKSAYVEWGLLVWCHLASEIQNTVLYFDTCRDCCI